MVDITLHRKPRLSNTNPTKYQDELECSITVILYLHIYRFHLTAVSMAIKYSILFSNIFNI